jgi:hypothetical protein
MKLKKLGKISYKIILALKFSSGVSEKSCFIQVIHGWPNTKF